VGVLCPEDLTGAIMGELQSRRGMVEGIDTEGNFQKIIAKVPLSETYGFSSSLRSITQGRAKFQMKFDSYQAMSYDLQKKLTEEYYRSTEESFA
jgi:elongation factor G